MMARDKRLFDPRALWIAGVCAFFPACSLAQEVGSDLKRIRPVYTSTPPTIDGRLDDEVWSTAGVVDDLHQLLPTEYAVPTEPTTIYVLYDEDTLYVGAKLWDSEPEEITARILRQGELVGPDDAFGLLLSPFYDQRSGYLFAVNPNGVRVEGLYEDASRLLMDWGGIWRAQSSVDDEGWVTEVAIPLKSLSFDPTSDEWGLNFFRRISRKRETMGWVSRNRTQNPSISGVAEGLSGLRQGVGLDVVPSVSASKFKGYSPPVSQTDTNPSLDVFYKFTTGLTGVLTVNTDFSATEVDDRQVNLTRFNLFFPEKRAFFLQDADIFEFGRIGAFPGPDNNNARPFFSRTIGLSQSRQQVDLEGGVKLSGRVGRWNVGVLGIRQEQFSDVAAKNLFVGRVTANVLRESAVGMIVTEGDPNSNLDNSLVGVDFHYLNTRFAGGRPLEGGGWFQKTETPGLVGDDSAFSVALSANTREGLGAFANFKEIQQNFRPALGFTNRIGVRNTEASLYYIHRPANHWLRAVQSRLSFDRFERIIDGGIESEEISVRLFGLENHSADSLNVDWISREEGLIDPFEISNGIVIPVGNYEFDRVSAQLNTGTQRKFSAGFAYETGDFFGGNSESFRPSINWRPSENFRLNVEYRVDDVELPQGSFATRLTRLRTDIVFSSTLSWVNLLQWDNVSGTLGINSRLHWIPQAGREAFLVLNHNMRDTDGRRHFKSDTAELSAKINYTIRF